MSEFSVWVFFTLRPLNSFQSQVAPGESFDFFIYGNYKPQMPSGANPAIYRNEADRTQEKSTEETHTHTYFVFIQLWLKHTISYTFLNIGNFI